jgi:RHS repeat-associated protein
MLTNEDNDYKVEFTYGVLGLQSFPYEEKQSYVGGTAYTKTVTRVWDSVGNKAGEQYPSGLNLTYAWNDIDHLSSISDGSNTIASFNYVGLRKKKTTFQNGTTRTDSFTGFRNEIATVKHETSTPTTILQLDYGYNAVHDRTYERYGSSGSSGDAFEYDKIRRLTVGWMGSSNPASPSGNTYAKKIEYNYDDDGNRTSVVTTLYGQSPSTSSYTTNSLYEYTAVGGTNYAWDANGNLTDNGTYLFEYNYKNLIARAKLKATGATVGTYKHDALGRRVEKAVTGATHRYLYSDLETVCVYDGSNNWVSDFVFQDEIDGIVMLQQADRLDFDSDSNTTETTRAFYHRNALGSVMEITAMDQAVEVSYRYEPYGSVRITRGGVAQATDPLGQPWMFTARFSDAETSTFCFRARQYAPAIGGFPQRDPIGYSDGPNLYCYARSNPIAHRDPRGTHVERKHGPNDILIDGGSVGVITEDAYGPCEDPCADERAAAKAAQGAFEKLWDASRAAEDAATKAADDAMAAAEARIDEMVSRLPEKDQAVAKALHMHRQLDFVSERDMSGLEALAEALEQAREAAASAWDAFQGAQTAYIMCLRSKQPNHPEANLLPPPKGPPR